MTLLDPEENDLLQSVENDEWTSLENFPTEKQRYQLQAKEQIAQGRIELVLSPEDTRQIQDLAQRLDRSIPSITREILHKYLQGELVEKRQVTE
jgi:predicted DNA binding CopG/RHH family protein